MHGAFDDSLRLQATKMDTRLTNLDYGESQNLGFKSRTTDMPLWSLAASVIAHCNAVRDPESLGLTLGMSFH